MELKEVMNVMQVSGERIPSGYYKKPEVDAVIAEKDAEIAELQETNGIIANNAVRLNKDIAELKQKLESVQASMYCDVVDANMENRRLKRALWIAMAERAEAEHAHWATIWFCNTKISLNINKSSVSQDPYKSNTFRNASEWRNMWYDIASKCSTSGTCSSATEFLSSLCRRRTDS